MKRPFVFLNMAASVDGKITSARRDYPRMTSAYDRTHMDRLRASADAVLVGAGTMRADQPKLWVRTEAMQQHRRELGHAGGLLKIVVTASADLPHDNRFFDDADDGGLLVVTVDDADETRVQAMAERAEVWRVGQRTVDLPLLLQRLRDERGVARLLIEGGGELNWDFVQAGLVDELHLTVAPTLLGGRDAPTLLEGSGFPMDRQQRLRLLDVHREGDELYCRWAVER